MSAPLDTLQQTRSRVIELPFAPIPMNLEADRKKAPAPETPLYDQIIVEASHLDKISSYKTDFDYSVYQALELRFKDKKIRGGVVFKKPFRLVNAHHTCQQCLYAFEIDTYGRGCAHDCAYCYAKAELTVHGFWNNPIPFPIDINDVRETFYTVFETDKRNKWRGPLERKIPLRIGSMTDSFMFSDRKYKVTKELLKILRHYDYPSVIFTRSDLVAADDYIEVMDPKLNGIQMSISSINDELNRLIEPGAPSAKRRLQALTKLSSHGFWTTVRINPLFPIYPDGYFTNPDFQWNGPVPQFPFSSFDMVDAIADAGVPSVLAGFVRFSTFALNNIQRVTGFDLKQFYRKSDVNKSSRDWHFSDREIRHYYETLYISAKKRGVQFTTCYIGNGENHFWKDQDLWSNKSDCCNLKGRLPNFVTDSRSIAFVDRVKMANAKGALPVNEATLHAGLNGDGDSPGLVVNLNEARVLRSKETI